MSGTKAAAKTAAANREPITGEWAGFAQFLCPFCPYDALNDDAVRAHIAEKHPLPPPKITAPVAPEAEPDAKE